MSRMMKPWLVAVLFGMCSLLLVDGQARSGEKKGTGPLLSKEDSLSTDDGRDTKLQNSYRKTYKVKFAEGKTYQIDLKSKDFDAVLRIENSDGKEVAFNDDAPGGRTLDSQIVYKADKGGASTPSSPPASTPTAPASSPSPSSKDPVARASLLARSSR